MTETNINALCSVEAVFDGIDIEVTVEFSAGGGTFEHDELTAESRAKANQHPIPSITGLQSALDGKANSSHVHTISDVTGLQLALDGKSNVGHGHNDLTGRDASDVHPKESITGLRITDTPEFADTQITPLAAEATYSANVWNYLVGLFTTVPKSILQHIVKVWTVLQNLSSRTALLEDKYILKYVVPVNTTSIELTTDKYGNAFNFVEGDTLQITFNIAAWTVITSNLARISMRINNIFSSIYNVQNVVTLNEAITAGTNYKSQRTTITITLINNEVVGVISNQSINSTDVKVTDFYPFYTTGLNSSTISSLKFLLPNSNAMIPAGTVFLIKKI